MYRNFRLHIKPYSIKPKPSRWLKQFLQQSTSSLQTTIHNCGQSDEDLIIRFHTAKRKLDALQQLTSTTIRKLRLLVKDQIEKLCLIIAEMLTQEDVRKELTDWSTTPFPPAPPLGSGDVSIYIYIYVCVCVCVCVCCLFVVCFVVVVFCRLYSKARTHRKGMS